MSTAVLLCAWHLRDQKAAAAKRAENAIHTPTTKIAENFKYTCCALRLYISVGLYAIHKNREWTFFSSLPYIHNNNFFFANTTTTCISISSSSGCEWEREWDFFALEWSFWGKKRRKNWNKINFVPHRRRIRIKIYEDEDFPYMWELQVPFPCLCVCKIFNPFFILNAGSCFSSLLHFFFHFPLLQ